MITQKFRVRGLDFDTAEEAERHEAVSAAWEEFRRAESAVLGALARTQRTADGEPFGGFRSMFNPYYSIRWVMGGKPHLVEWSSIGWQLEFDRRTPEGEIHVRLRETNGNANRLGCGHHEQRTVEISDLYASKAAAERALLVKMEEWLAEKFAELDELRARVQPAGSRT